MAATMTKFSPEVRERAAQMVQIFCAGGARPRVQTMIQFIEDHRADLGFNQSAASCRLPRRRFTTAWPSASTHRGFQIGRCVTPT
jgi:hypothetical protein